MKYVVFSGLLMLVGCSNNFPRDKNYIPPGTPFYAMSGTQLDKTFVVYLLYDQRLVAAVWCDIDFSIPGCSGSHGTRKVGDNPSIHYNSLRSGDGRFVEWTVDTKNGKAEITTINGREFRLADGSLFLVRTRIAGTPITQVKVDLNSLPFTGKSQPDPALWGRLAQKNVEVKKFLAEAEKN